MGTRKRASESLYNLLDDSFQLAFGIFARHVVQHDRFDFSGLAGAAERLKACLANIFCRGRRILEKFARVELALVFSQMTADCARHGETNVRIDIDLAYSVL